MPTSDAIHQDLHSIAHFGGAIFQDLSPRQQNAVRSAVWAIVGVPGCGGWDWSLARDADDDAKARCTDAAWKALGRWGITRPIG